MSPDHELSDPERSNLVASAREAVKDLLEQQKTLRSATSALGDQFTVRVVEGVLAGFRAPDPPGEPPPSVTRDYRLLRDNGVNAESQRRLLSDLNAARIALNHRYGEPATPQELHTAASLAGNS